MVQSDDCLMGIGNLAIDIAAWPERVWSAI